MKKKKPQALIDYERNVHEMKAPHFCHNCSHYDEFGNCKVFDLEPPEEFTSVANECPHWEEEPPF